MPPPIPSMPYAPKSLYTPRYADNIAQLLTRQGDIQAAGAARSGEIWGNFARDIGQIGGQAFQAYGEQQAQKKEAEIRARREEAFTSIIQTWDAKDPIGFTKRLTSAVGPMEAMKFTGAMLSFEDVIRKNQKGEMPTIEDVKQGILGVDILTKNAPGEFEKQYPMLREQYGPAIKEYFGGYELPEVPTPEVVTGLRSLAQQIGAKGGEQGFTLGPGQVRFGPTGEQIAAGPEKPEGPDTRSIEVQLADAAARGDQEAYSRLLKVKREATAAGRAPAAPPAPPAEMTFNPEGVVLSSYGIKQKAEVRKQAMERGLPVFETAASQAKGTVLAGIVADAKELNDLMALPEVKDAVGPVAGRWTQLKGNITSLDPDVRRALQLMNSLSDTELRKRSGAQINDKEMQRLLKFTTDPNKPLDHNTVAVAGLLKSAARDYKALSSVDLGTNEEPPDAR